MKRKLEDMEVFIYILQKRLPEMRYSIKKIQKKAIKFIKPMAITPHGFKVSDLANIFANISEATAYAGVSRQ